MTSRPKTKVAIYGLGYIGRMVFEAIQNENPFYNRNLELVGVVDIVAESCLWAQKQDVFAYQSLKDLLTHARPDVVIHTTASNMSMVLTQLKELIEAKIPVVSSAEELFFPWQRNGGLAQELNELCVKHGVAVLGTGINPGFIMDVLPALMTQVCHTVDQVKVVRVVNASTRRLPLQRKIGVGLDEKGFRDQVASGRINPVGLLESMDFLASYMGWTLTNRGQSVEPILAHKALRSEMVSVKKDHVAGLRHQAHGEMNHKRVIELDLKIYLDAERPGDRITIRGNPPVNVWVDGGVPGDPGAAASLIHGIPIVLQARPGIVRRLERDHFTA